MSRRAEPRPLKQHQAKTIFVRCPSPSWALVSTGRVREFRCAAGNAPQLWKVPLPSLAIIYRRQLSVPSWDYRLMLLENVRREALASITSEGLALAGYKGDDAFARFRRDWMIGEKKRFEPLRTVFVYTVRPIQDDGDLTDAGSAIIDHLYGDYLAKETHKSPRTIQAERGAASSARGGREAVAG